MGMRRSDLEWKLRDRENLTEEEIERCEAALDGDQDAWDVEAALQEECSRESAADYAAERRCHSSPADYRGDWW